MAPEYDLSKMKIRPNPFAKQLKKQVTISLGIDVIEYFEMMAQEEGISYSTSRCYEVLMFMVLGNRE